MQQNSNEIKFSFKMDDDSNRTVGIMEGKEWTQADYIEFYDVSNKIIVFKDFKFDCVFSWDWDNFSIYFGDFVRFVWLVTKKLKFLKTGKWCSGNIGNNCVLNLGSSNNISLISWNFVKFNHSTIIDGKDDNILIGLKAEDPIYMHSAITLNDGNYLSVGHQLSTVSVNSMNSVKITLKEKFQGIIQPTGMDNVMYVVPTVGNLDGNVPSDTDVAWIADFLEKASKEVGKGNISNLQNLIGQMKWFNKTSDKSKEAIWDEVNEEEDFEYFSDKTVTLLKKTLRKNVIGQDIVLDKIDDFLDGINIKTKKGPTGVFFQVGKTGVGKNYLWEVLTEVTGIPLKTIDASTFHETEWSSLLWTTQGYVGSSEPSILETFYEEAEEHGGRIVILIDELDKITVGKSWDKQGAIVAFLQTLMNLFENDKVLLKNNGFEIDISRFIFVMNTNLFLDEQKIENKLVKKIGFAIDEESESEVAVDFEKCMREKIKGFLPLSIFNRISSNFLFYADMDNKVIDDLIKKEWKIVTDAIKNHFGDVKLPTVTKYKQKIIDSYDKDLWMRGMKNFIHDHIKPELIKIAKESKKASK